LESKKSGAALVMVLMISLILTIIGSTVLSIALSDTKQATYQIKRKQAYYSAYSGADAMASYIITHPDEVNSIIGKGIGTSEIGGATLNLQLFKVDGEDLLIKSTGNIPGISPVNVSLSLEKVTNPVFDYTVFGDYEVNIGNNTVVNGDVGTNAKSINNKGKINGNIFTELGITLPLTDPSPFNYYTGTYKLKNNDKLYIKADIVNDDLIKKFKWDANQPADAKAQIHLFAENSLKINNINPPSGVTVFLYYNKEDSITENNGSYYIKNCVIYAPKATFSKNGGGNGDYLGGIIIVKKCTLPNSHATIDPGSDINKEDILGIQTYTRKKWSD